MYTINSDQGIHVFGYDKKQFEAYCVELMQKGFIMTNNRTVTLFPMFWFSSYSADFLPPEAVKPYTFSEPFTFEMGRPCDLKQRLSEALEVEDYEQAAMIRDLLNDKAA